MAKSFSFDVVSDFDKSEMDNTIDQARREIGNRYDFKGTPAGVELIEDKTALKITGDSQYQLDAIMDIVRKKAAGRNISQKAFDTKANEPTEANLQMSWIVPLVKGLSQDKAKKITKLLKDKLPKVKTQIQGEEIRVTSSKKDELQAAMSAITEADLDFPAHFTNLR